VRQSDLPDELVIGVIEMKIQTSALKGLLDRTQRKHTVAGATNPQVVACMIRGDGQGTASVTSLVKDGVTSLSRFSCDAESPTGCAIPIPDIERIKGALKFHGGLLTLSFHHGKLRLKSGAKSTTLLASENAKAFPHSPHSLGEWERRSMEQANSITYHSSSFPSGDGTVLYTTKNGTKINPMFSAEIDAVELFEAVRCVNMNSQKSNTFTFTLKDRVLSLTVGGDLKGATTTVLRDDIPLNDGSFEAAYHGGLNHVLQHLNGSLTLNFLDFRSFNQGIAMLITHGERDFIYQAGIVDG